MTRFSLGAALGAALACAILFALNPLPPRPAPEPLGPPELAKSIHLYDWTGAGKIGDLLVCTCAPGRLEKAPTPRRAGP